MSAGSFRHVVLVGLSGSGKSTTGRTLAKRLGRPFVDTDDLIVERAGRPIPAVFKEEGEAAFRRYERDAVRRALDASASVIATGGGAPVDAGNRQALWQGNTVVWLDAPVDVLVRRLDAKGSGRPLLEENPAARLASLREAREAIYATAHIHIDTSALSAAQAVERILAALEERR